MKIKKLKIEGYKNLEVELIHSSDIIALIGNNGSGKSNLLEAISLIFRSLYKSNDNVSFDYYIEYSNTSNQLIKIEKKKSKLSFHVDSSPVISIGEYLPKKLIAIYSGEEDRLWQNCFYPFYDDYVKNINKSKAKGLLQSANQMPQMLYLNKFYWHLSLLSLALSDLDDNKKFIKEVLKIDKIDKIKFVFDKENYKEYNGNLVLDFVRKIDGKSEYSLSELQKIMQDNHWIPDDVYKLLYVAFSPKSTKIISEIIIKFNDHLTVEDLSEGEKKLLLIKAAFEFAEQEDSLFILDEPDAHIHLNNKDQIIKTFEPYKNNRQIVITTHSPTVTQSIDDDNLYMVNSGKIIERKKQEIISDLTEEFWNKHQQSSFISTKKPIILLVEGKHDKEHITSAYNKLQDEFQDLKFEVFKLNSETNIQPFMRGLYESEFVSDKLYIGIYDNDGAGKATLENRKNFDAIDGKVFKKIIENQKANVSYFACALPKPEGIICDCTIETMFDSKKFEEAYQTAINNAIGHFSNKSIDSITDNIKEQAKNILCENSKNFSKEDFKNFRAFFELINEIKSYSINIKSPDTKATAIPVKDTSLNAKKSEIAESDIVTYKTVDFIAKGIYDNERGSLLLLKGSEIRKKHVPSIETDYKKWRENEIKTLKEGPNNNVYILNQDKKFNSSSAAAKFVNGGNANGWKVWRNKDGKSLDEIYR